MIYVHKRFFFLGTIYLRRVSVRPVCNYILETPFVCITRSCGVCYLHFLYSCKESLVTMQIFVLEILETSWSSICHREKMSVRPSVGNAPWSRNYWFDFYFEKCNCFRKIRRRCKGYFSVAHFNHSTARARKPRKKIPVRKPVYRFWLNFSMV